MRERRKPPSYKEVIVEFRKTFCWIPEDRRWKMMAGMFEPKRKNLGKDNSRRRSS